MTTSLAYMQAQGLEPTITKTLKQVVHEKPSNAALRLGELLTEQCALPTPAIERPPTVYLSHAFLLYTRCTAEPPLKHHAVVIIGGGVGGLYTALRLLENTPGMDLQLFEGRGELGGRVHTTRDGEGKPLFNDFGARPAPETLAPSPLRGAHTVSTSFAHPMAPHLLTP